MNSRRVRDCKGFGGRLPFVHLRFISIGFREKGTGTIIRVTGWRLQVAGYEMQVAGYGLRVRGGEVLLCCG